MTVTSNFISGSSPSDEWEVFEGTQEDKVFPSTQQLVQFEHPEDLDLFSENNKLSEIPVEVAKGVPRPPSILLVTGEVFYGMVALHGDSSYQSGEDHGYYFSIREVLSYIRLATVANYSRSRFDTIVYFALAVHQELNPAIPKLARVMMESQASKEVAINYHQLRVRFSQYNNKLVHDRKNQKISDDRKKARSDRHRSVRETDSPQTQFPLRDVLWDEEFLDSANRDSNTSSSAYRSTQQREEDQRLEASIFGYSRWTPK